MSAVDERLEVRVRDLEVTMWGVDRTNGIRAQVKEMREVLEALPEKFRNELHAALEDIEGRDDKSRSQRLVIVGLIVTCSVTLISSMITAIATLVH